MIGIYELKSQTNVVEIPSDGNIVSVQTLKDHVCLCVLQGAEGPFNMVKRTFIVRGSGYPFDSSDNEEYVGTISENNVIVHVFEQI